MILDKNSDSYLWSEYIVYKEYRFANRKKKEQFASNYYNSLLRSYFNDESVRGDRESIDMVKKLFDTMYVSFNVDCISKQLEKHIDSIKEQLLESIPLGKLYDTLGCCSGYILFDKWCFSYIITESLSYFTCNKRIFDKYSPDTILFIPRGKKGGAKDIMVRDNEKDGALISGLAILMAKKQMGVETKIIGSGVRKVIKETEETVINRTPFFVNYVGCSEYKTIVKMGDFPVRGFYRRQRVGVGRKQIKLIYVDSFMKHGYTRKAKKLIAQEKEIREALSVA